MIKRHLEKELIRAARQYPVISLTGPRQSGKTTLAKAAFPGFSYVNLENSDIRAMALNDPRQFLAKNQPPLIIDEAQRVPELFSYIQSLVDESGANGQYVLTGSQNFLLAQNISQSLAGRVAVFHLLPFSISELEGREPRDWDDPDAPGAKEGAGLSDLDDILTHGMYPRVRAADEPPRDWLQNYVETYIERDVRLILNVGDLDSFRRFMTLCAAHAGQMLNLSNLAVGCSISQATARRWLALLRSSFIIELIQPFYRNLKKRISKRPKLFFYDPGLLCRLLGVFDEKHLEAYPARGAVFENLVFAELAKSYFHTGREPRLFYWRESNSHEVDFVLDQGERQRIVEVKSSSTFSQDFLKGIEYWRKLARQPEGGACVVYAGQERHLVKGIEILPWQML